MCRFIGQFAVTVSRMLRSTFPWLSIRRNELCDVASWKNDFFSFGKKVSGVQIVFTMSMPAKRFCLAPFSAVPGERTTLGRNCAKTPCDEKQLLTRCLWPPLEGPAASKSPSTAVHYRTRESRGLVPLCEMGPCILRTARIHVIC